MKASLSTILFNLPADLACPCRHCFPSRQRHTLPKQKIVCSPTHSFGEKKLHFPIVCGNMMEVHWGQRMRRETQSAQSAQTYHESEFHRNIVFKAQSKTSDPCALFSVVQTPLLRSYIPAVHSSHVLSFTFSLKHNTAALIMALIGQYTSILS